MAYDTDPKYVNQLEQDSHDNSANITGKRVILFGWNPTALQYERLQSSNGFLQSSPATDNFATDTALTITLASLANSAVGVGRQSTLVDNTTNKYLSALIYLSIKMGTLPTANTPIYVYLIRSNNDDPIADDGAGASDAGITIVNASLLGIINCSATTTGAVYSASFDTSPLGPLGPKWGIAIVNNTGAALDSTEGNHLKKFIGITKNI